MDTKKYAVSIEFITEVLGATPKSKEVYAKYIQSKAPEGEGGDEIESVTDIEEKGWTGFHQDEKGVFFLDYVIRGFLKEAATALKAQTGEVKNVKSKIDRLVFVFPRKLYLLRDGGPIAKVDSVFERPLRAMTMQGPRVTLARSDMLDNSVKGGLGLKFGVEIVANKEGVTWEFVKELFEYGRLQGLGQFRNGSFGRFEIKA